MPRYHVYYRVETPERYTLVTTGQTHDIIGEVAREEACDPRDVVILDFELIGDDQ